MMPTEPEVLELTDAEKLLAASGDPTFIPEADEAPETDNGEVSQDAESIDGGKEAAPPVDDDAVADIEAEAPAEVENDSRQEPTPAQAATWIDTAAIELGNGFGLEEKDLKRFGTRDEFLKAVWLADKQLVSAAKQPIQPAPTPTAPPAKPDATPLNLDPEQFAKDGYDEKTVEIVKYAKQLEASQQALKAELDTLKPHLAYTQEAVAQWQAAQQNIAFHDACDSLNDERLGKSADQYGRPVPLDAKANDQRRQIHDAYAQIIDGINARAQRSGETPQFPSTKTLVERARLLAFGEDAIRNDERAKVKAELTARSKQRRPAATGRGYASTPTIPKTENLNDLAEAIAKLPAQQRVYEKFSDK